MFTLFIVAVVVICILVFFMFFILKGTVKKINSQTKLYFVDKLQEYDYLIDQKEEKLNKINQEIKEKELKRESDDTSTRSKTYEFDYQFIDLLNKTKYQDKNVFELTKKIDEKFNLDYVGLLKKFLSYVEDDGTYQFCIDLRNKFTSDEIYRLKVMNLEEQKKYLQDKLSFDEYKIYQLYLKLDKNAANVDGFIDYLNEMIDLNNPNILVYVGKKDENYDYLSKYVKTIYSKDIYRGIKIIYRKRIYDYSLNERNV
ncbi:MAG: hypothetical protein MR598_06835 [Erysipelotrichaceae bacterium]|nr:hypothetical protein [Erysipelotrichaceae bacterium]